MNEEAYFFDTYAFFEIIRGNPKYSKYYGSFPITTILNIAELNYGLKRDYGKLTADKYADKYAVFATDITIEDIKLATDLKRENKKLSLADVLGYTIANRLCVKFLTGDEQFETLPNVEFIRK